MYSITHFFTVDNNRYALDYQNLFCCLLDDETESALKHYLYDSNAPTVMGNKPSAVALDAMIKCGYFLTQHPVDTVPKFEYDTINISFAPVHDCNLACKYCYARGGKEALSYKTGFDKSKIDRLIDFIYLEKYSHYNNYKFDFVSGGEPLLHFDILEYFLHKTRTIDETYGKKTTILVVTNGTLLDTEKINILDNYGVFLGVSIDGSEKIHNSQRVYNDGRGTYDDIVRNLNILYSMEASSRIKEPWAMSVITRNTQSLVDLMETCVGLGFKHMQMQLVRLPHSNNLSITGSHTETLKKHYKELFSHILSYAANGDYSRIKMIANHNDSFGKLLGRILLRTPVFYRCFAAKNKFAIDANGELFPCDSFCSEKDFSFGSMYSEQSNEAVIDKFNNAHIFNREKCLKCWARFICGGDCFYHSYMISGNILDPNPVTCEMNRFFIENAVDILIKLQSIDAKAINYLAKIYRIR